MPGVKSPAELTDLFRAQGLKVTPQRQAIFRVLHESAVHPTAEAVHAEVTGELPMVSLRTVYQTLNDLAAMGELVQLDLGTGSARFDPTLTPHHHLVCDGCGRVTDVEAEFPGVAVPAHVEPGFTVSTTQIVFRGRCDACANEPAGVGAHRPPADQRNNTKEARQRYG
ncbi:MAG: transcription regulator Fur family [Acidimicrobiales bacterium]|nr:transcription regulator Fur family [Acidimicrobiales bacterium]